MRKPLYILPILFLFSAHSLAQPRQAIGSADIVRVANSSDARISPNGQWVVYTVSTVEEDKNLSNGLGA